MDKKLKRGVHKTQKFKENFENLMGGKQFTRSWNAKQKSGPKLKHSETSRMTDKMSERKRKRQENRIMKKRRRHAFSQRKPMPNQESEKAKEKKKLEEEIKEKNILKRRKKESKRKRALQRKKKRNIMKEKEDEQKVEDIRKRNMQKDIVQEEKTLKQLEKQLHMNKRKRKGLPQSFLADGLDYILDVVDKDKISGILENTQEMDSDSNNTDIKHEDAAWLKSKKRKIDVDKGNCSDDSNDDGDDSNEDEDVDDDHDDGDDDDDHDDDDDDNDDEVTEENDDDDDDEMIEASDDDDDDDDVDENDDRKQKLIDKIMSKILPSKHRSQTLIDKPSTKITESPCDVLDSSKVKSILKKQKSNEKVKGQVSKQVSFPNIYDKDTDKDSVQDDEDGSSDDGRDECDDIQSDEESDEIMDDNDSNDDESDDMDYDEDAGDDIVSKRDNKALNTEKSKSVKSSLKEDIYGRLRDKSGNVVKESSGSYVPPGKRLALAANSSVQLERLNRQLKGFVNRASAANMNAICSQIEDLYLTNSRGDMNQILSSLVLDACVSMVMTPERLAMELVMLLTILNGNVGTEVGATFCQSLAERFDVLCTTAGGYGQGKEMDNVTVLFCYLYNFKVIHSILISDLIKKFVDSFGEKDIELILLILKNVGFTLRKDDPAGLKELIQQIQSKASVVDTSDFTEKSRVQYMLDILLAVKNNNMRKIPNYDPELFEELKKQTRVLIKVSSLGADQLRISLRDLIEAKNKGRWWVVGSAWEGRDDVKETSVDQSPAMSSAENSANILNLARKQRMNTDIRRNIFCVIMSSEDFVDAFEKLLRLGLKHKQEREIIYVILDCCQQEKTFNPFYAYLMQKFCEFDRRFQMTFQFTMWDKFKEMGNLSEQNRENLAKLMIHLLTSKAVSISVFKVVEFGTLDKFMVRFLKQVLQGLLLDYPEDVIETVFIRIAPLTKLKALQDGLRLFMQHFLLRKKAADSTLQGRLKERISLAEKALSSSQTKMLL